MSELPTRPVYLFVAMGTNSGSGLVYEYLGRCRRGVILDEAKEGTWIIPPDSGPRHPLYATHKRIWATDPHLLRALREDYNWHRVKTAYLASWRKSALAQRKHLDGSVLIEKSTLNVVRVPGLAEHFEQAWFLVGVRNPWAVAEGIKRKERQPIDKAGLQAVAYLRFGLENLKYKSVAFTYEEFCKSPKRVQNKIVERIPRLDDLAFDGTLYKKGLGKAKGDARIQNLNWRSVERLSQHERKVLLGIFSENASVLEAWGYEVQAPARR